MISFVRYFGIDSETNGPRGERFQDNAQFEGPLPEVIDQAVSRCITNMKQSTLIEGILHRMIPEYPEEALREAFSMLFLIEITAPTFLAARSILENIVISKPTESISYQFNSSGDR